MTEFGSRNVNLIVLGVTNEYRKKHILAVEDDLDIQQIISLYLHDSGYKLSFVNSGKDLYAFFKAGNKPDLVLLDLGLPDADGLQLTEQIRAFSNVPIFVVTARTGQDDKVTALSLGADDYLTKPFDPEELRLRINNLLLRATPQETPDQAPAPQVSQRQNMMRVVFGIVAFVLVLSFGLYKLLYDQPVIETARPKSTDLLSLDVSARCDGPTAIFTVTNTGDRWPQPGEVRIYRVSSQTTVTRRRLLMALNQSAKFKVNVGKEANYTDRNTGSEGVGIWIKPSWYSRAFTYDATVNCY